MEKYIIDMGSSTIKLNSYKNGVLNQVASKSIDLKYKFDKDNGFSEKKEQEIFNFLNLLISTYSLSKNNTKIFATGIFRDLNFPHKFIDKFYLKTKLYLNIISHELESFFLEKAWDKISEINEKILLVNIGGKTTELITKFNNQIVEVEKINIGVGTILKKFKNINLLDNSIEFEEIVSYIKKYLPKSLSCSVALYTGGELTYMKRMKYELEANDIFTEQNHLYKIDINKFREKNKYIYYNISLDELKKFMPENPDWMAGAKACSALAQAIFENCSVKSIVPSDSNLINGAVNQEFEKVVLCGSYNRYLKEINNLKVLLENNNVQVLSPKCTQTSTKHNGFILFHGEKVENDCTWLIERKHLNAIDSCDAVIICNYEGYVGKSTNIELGYALSKSKKIIFLEYSKSLEDFDFPYEIGIIQ